MEGLNIEQALDGLRRQMRELSVQMSALSGLVKQGKFKIPTPGKNISFDDAARVLGISASSIRKRKCGTEDLHHVRFGRRVMLVRAEVEQLAARRIAESITPRERAGRKLRSA